MEEVEASCTANVGRDIMWVIADEKGPLLAWRGAREGEEVLELSYLRGGGWGLVEVRNLH